MCFNQQEGSGLTTPVVGHERSVLSTKVLLPSPPLPSKVLVHWQHQAQKKMFNTQIYFSIIIYSQCRKLKCVCSPSHGCILSCLRCLQCPAAGQSLAILPGEV